MSLVKKYDQTLRRRFALRAVWLPGTDVQVGDILLSMNGSLVSVGNLNDEKIGYSISPIGKAQSINLKSRGVSQILLQNGATVSLSELDTTAEAELNLTFKDENSYFLRTPVLSGEGLDQAMIVARKIAKIPSWDHLKNYIIHKVWSAEDFMFLGNLDKSSEITFRGKGAFIKNIITGGINSEINSGITGGINNGITGGINNGINSEIIGGINSGITNGIIGGITSGITSGVSITGSRSMNLELMGESGPIVMQIFRVKRNGDIF
jgi:hypothetical protein